MLADLLEQPRRGAAAERGVEHAEGVAAVVGAGQPVDAEHQVDLLERAGRRRRRRSTYDGRARPRRTGSGRTAASVEEAGAGERRAHLAYDGRVVDVAGDRDDHVARAVVAPVEARDLVAGQRRDRLDGARRSAGPAASRPRPASAKRLCTTSSGSSSCIAISSRITSRSASTSSAVISRGGDHVAEHVDGQRQVLVEDPRVEAGVLLGGEGVELTADRVERDRDVQRRALARCP